MGTFRRFNVSYYSLAVSSNSIYYSTVLEYTPIIRVAVLTSFRELLACCSAFVVFFALPEVPVLAPSGVLVLPEAIGKSSVPIPGVPIASGSIGPFSTTSYSSRLCKSLLTYSAYSL